MLEFNLSGKRAILTVAVAAIVGFALGLIVLHLATSSGTPDQMHTKKQTMGETPSFVPYETMYGKAKFSPQQVYKKILDRMDRKKIKENLRYLTERPHIAGGARDEELARHIHDSFKLASFDHAEMVPYNVLLSYPNQNKPNKITLKRGGSKIFESHHMEEPIRPDDKDPEFIHAFNAYTPAGTVTTEPGVGIVYVNYGRIEDFQKLEQLGVNVSGHIAMVRYGKIFRGNKVEHAQKYGAIGLIIFSDPEDVAAAGTEPENVYDKTQWLPGTGIQRGSTFIGIGDPLTPGWPSTEHAFRITQEEANLPKIPAQPIGYEDARKIIEHVDGQVAPEEWQGGMKGINYNLGPFFTSDYKDVSLTLSTHNYLEVSKNYNVFGIIKGQVEPDRYVFMGNHRDAWGYGSSDPSSGTAQLLESVRVLGTLLKDGWRPRRTIIFCSWGAEEHALIGSTEWVEEHINKLSARTVAHLNIDICVSGSAPHYESSPLLWEASHHVSKLVPGVRDPSKTLFDEWNDYQKIKSPQENETPVYKSLGSGSDHAAFSFMAGIPAGRFEFRMNKNEMHNISWYPYYHTGYETFYMISQIEDPDFKYIQSCGSFASIYLTYFSDSAIIPYSLEQLPKQMMKALKDSKHRQALLGIYDKYMELEKAVERFAHSTRGFTAKLNKIGATLVEEPLKLRAINDQQMLLERIFISPYGLPMRNPSDFRHVIFSPSLFNKYESSGFPGLADLMHDYGDLSGESKMAREAEIKRHISDLTIMTDRATSHLKDLHLV